MRLSCELMRRTILILFIALISSCAFAATKYGRHPIIKPVPPLGAWKTDFTSGVATLRSGDRPTLLMISISSDPACREAKEMLADAAVQQSLAKWNLLYDDTDCYARFEKVLWYRTVPFFIMFDKDGNEISRCGAGMTAAEFEGWIFDIYAHESTVTESDAVLKVNPNDDAALAKKAGSLIYMGIKMYSPDIRFAVSMPERLDRAIAVAKQAQAAGDTSAGLKDGLEFAEAVVQVLRGQLDKAEPRLAVLASNQKNYLFEDAQFWLIYIKMVRNESNPIRNHDPETDELYKQYAERNPKHFYGAAARRRVEYVNAEIAKEKADE